LQAGLTIGRFVLTHIATRVGEKPFVVVMTVGCLAFQFLVWFVPSIIGEAVAVAIIGLLIGPIYPGAQTVFTRLLPGKLQVFAIGFISSMGSSGGDVCVASDLHFVSWCGMMRCEIQLTL